MIVTRHIPPIYHHVKDEGPKTFQMAVEITQRINAPDYMDIPQMPSFNNNSNPKLNIEPAAGPMDIVIQNTLFGGKKNLLD